MNAETPRRQTILVIDDEPDVVRSVQDLLRFDYRTLGATRAEDGLAMLQREDIDVLMTDQRMPGMSGVELLRRARAERPDTIRLLFTGYADIKAVIDAINQGNVYRYITKPWDPDELMAILRQAAAQRELLLERKRLLAELCAKNEALEAANTELRQANELKEAFIRVASHELRTPLAIMLGLIELARRQPEPGGPAPSWVETLHRAAMRLSRLVDQILKLMLARQFERPLQRRPTDLAALLRTAADDVKPFIERRKQQLALDVPPDLGTMHLEADKIRDCLDNLLLNAIKFTPDGGDIRLRARRLDEGGVEIQVSDSGIGVDPASLPHLFRAFFTGFDVSRHSSGQFEFGKQGIGLGLTLVRTFVELHGGTITATRGPEGGMTFTLRLPEPQPAAG